MAKPTPSPLKGLTSFYVAALLKARDGTMFVGTSDGLFTYANGQINWLARKPELISPDVRTICEAGDGTMWFGMSGGGLGCLKDGKLRQYLLADGLSSDFVQCLHLETNGALWIGTFGGGLTRFKDSHFSTALAGMRDCRPATSFAPSRMMGMASFG